MILVTGGAGFIGSHLVDVPMFGDGSTARDCTYIDDIIQGVLASLDRVLGFQVFNLGESQTTRLRDLIGMLQTISGRKANVAEQALQPGDVEITYADVTKARRLLDYRPTTPVDLGLRRFVEWFEETAADTPRPIAA